MTRRDDLDPVEGINAATSSYERWMEHYVEVRRDELDRKHDRMRRSDFEFLRATFYRWAQQFPVVCPDLAAAPHLLGVGDLHVENYGLWRDVEGRPVWGINDFDEAGDVPYTNDLVRLVTSALFALPDLAVSSVADRVLTAYRDTLIEGGRSLVIGEENQLLWSIMTADHAAPAAFWRDLIAGVSPCVVTDEVAAALRSTMPPETVGVSFAGRLAGLGSLGRNRVTALGHWRGALVAREYKAVTPSAWTWAHGGEGTVQYARIAGRAKRSPDPWTTVGDGVVIRRLAPDSRRIDLADVTRVDRKLRLFSLMGCDLANVHLGDTGAVAAVSSHVSGLDADDLAVAARRMATAMRRDRKEFTDVRPD